MDIGMRDDDNLLDYELRILNKMLERNLEDCQFYSQKMFRYREIIIQIRKDWVKETGLSEDQWPYAEELAGDGMFR